MSAKVAISGKKRPRDAKPAVETPKLEHSLKGCVFTSMQVPADSTYIDVFMKSMIAALGEEAVKPRSKASAEIVAYTQGRQLEADEWLATFNKGGKHCEVIDNGRVTSEAAHNLYFAVLRFSDETAAAKALNTAAAFPPTDGDGCLLGLRGWLDAHKSHNFDARMLQKAVDTYVADFDSALASTEAAKTELERRMNADGFTLVKRGSTRKEEEEEASRWESDNVRAKKKRGSLVKTDFYSFQRQENKLDKLAQLKAKFAEDREKIRKIKEGRKFKPY